MLEDFRANFLNRANPYASLVISQLFVCIHGSIYLTNGSMLPFVCSVQLLVIDHRWRQYGYGWKSGRRAAGKCCVTDLYTTLFNRFIRFKQWRARFKKKTPTCLISPFKCSWISSGIFQVTLYTTFRLYFSFSSLSYLWAVFPKSFSRPRSKKNELPQKCLKLRFSRSDDTRSWQPLWKFLSSSLAIRDDKDQSEINAVHCASAASKTSSS